MERPEVYGERAGKLFREGYNCSQSVAGAFCEEMGMERDQLFRMASSFGGGMGRMREVCGCVSGMFLVAGYFYGYDDPKAYEEKKELYGRIQELARRFREENGSIICRELLGLDGKDCSPVPGQRTEEYYKKRPCGELAAFAARMLAEYMEEQAVTLTK